VNCQVRGVTDIQSAHDDWGKCQTILEGGIPYLDRESKQLRNARAALRRLREGSFGVCEHRRSQFTRNGGSPSRGLPFVSLVRKSWIARLCRQQPMTWRAMPPETGQRSPAQPYEQMAQNGDRSGQRPNPRGNQSPARPRGTRSGGDRA
jgi:hypothetical protein